MCVSAAHLRQALARLCRARAGNVAVIIAIAVPALATLTLGATDVASIMNDRQRMRSIAEGAALAGARNLAVAMSENDAIAHALAMAEGMVGEWTTGPAIEVKAEVVPVDGGQQGVRVRLDANRPSFFNDLLPPGGWQYDIAATASSVGAVPLCVLAFAGADRRDFHMVQSSTITAPECLVHSNGDIVVDGGSIEAGRTQAVKSAVGDISPDPITDAPRINDPFASLALDTRVLGCVSRGGRLPRVKILTKGVHSLPPGDHCGALTVAGDAVLRLEPGEHKFGLGTLIATDRAKIIGDDVVLIFDATWQTRLLGQSVISLTGRREGLLAGFVVAADRDNRRPFEIDTAHVERLDGVIYIPNAELRITSRGDVARDSDWTVIVARRLQLSGNPNLVINADYRGADLSPPSGVGPRRDAVRLIE